MLNYNYVMLKNIIDILFTIIILIIGVAISSLFITVICAAGIHFYDDVTFLIVTFIVLMIISIIFKLYKQ